MLRAPGRNADAVAEMTVGLLFAVTRGIVPRRPRRAGRRDLPRRHHPLPALPRLAGRGPDRRASWATARSGRAGAWRFAGLGMNVISHDPFAPDATHSLDDLLAEADVVSMHAAVTPESHGMIGAEQFARMREGSRSTSTPHAPVLHDTDALTASLADGHLGGAGLDHFVGERLAVDHPLCAMSNVVLTPAHRRRDLRHRDQPHVADRRRARHPARRRQPDRTS